VSRPSAGPTRRPRRLAPRLVLLALATVAALLAGEAVVRIAGAGGVTLTRARLHAYDPDAGWTCAPDLDLRYVRPGSFDVRVLTNGRGLRDDEHAAPKPAGVVRVACLGDSFPWGYGVENDEMLSAVLERELPGCETINLGTNGYGTVQSLVRLETEGLRYEPDWAVLAFCWNDLEDNFDDKDGGRPALRMGDGSPTIVNRPVARPWKSPAKQWLRHHSRLFAAAESGWERLRLRPRVEGPRHAPTGSARPRPAPSPRAALRPRDAVGPPPAAVLAMDVDETNLELTPIHVARDAGAEVEWAWLGARWLLERIRDTMARSGGRLLVVAVTTRAEIDADLFARWRARLPPAERDEPLDPRSTAARLRRLCAELDVPFVDPWPAFAAHGAPDELFLRADGHWSAAGHALAARAVATRLRELAEG